MITASAETHSFSVEAMSSPEIEFSSSSSGKKRRSPRRRKMNHLVSHSQPSQSESQALDHVVRKLEKLQISAEQNLAEVVRELRDVVVNEVRQRLAANQSLRSDLRLQSEALLRLCKELAARSVDVSQLREEGHDLRKKVEKLADGVQGCRERVHGLGLAVAAQTEENERVLNANTRSVQFSDEHCSEGPSLAEKEDFMQRLNAVEQNLSGLNAVHMQQSTSLDFFRAQLQHAEQGGKHSHQVGASNHTTITSNDATFSRIARLEEALCNEVIDRQKVTQSMNEAMRFTLTWSKEKVKEITTRLDRVEITMNGSPKLGSLSARLQSSQSSPKLAISSSGDVDTKPQAARSYMLGT
eukprot:gnl/MRDRNA2_/MRDRNA2_117677_c0_seq1.p1 gnl/MRDRNA2_/MRDRNA2_117677_c0~~gnl/MRDRNA2_/MRDRNA2_117677_c0_seq1.p1  ORF type:complete len:355 (-),score=78.80 gnl/MRDRNA2_/MRDRNA2_117677_c0_seq1:11-1075(-)